MLSSDPMSTHTPEELARNYSADELKELKAKVVEAQVQKKYEDILELRSNYANSYAALRRAFEEVGITMEEGLAMKQAQFMQRLHAFIDSEKDQSKKPFSGIVPKKYQHPTNPELAWSGRGAEPVWMKEYFAANPTATREDLRIKDH
jgi:hypothetical protein